MSVVPSILEKKGIEAIKAKNMPEAFELLYEAYTNGERTDNILIGIALVSRSLSKFEISLKTADQFLQRNPNDVNANLVKADALNALGRESVAVGFYAAALRLSKEIQRIPPLLANDLERAKKACEIASRKMKSEIEQLINEVEHLEIKNSTRIEQMFDILIGKKQIYHQKPSKLYFPELPQIQFFEAIDFEWSQALIEARQEIKEELNQILTSEELFKPYLDHNPDAATGNTGLNLDNNWSAFHLVRDGKEISQNISMCPKTYQALTSLPLARIPGRSPNILFSKLKAGTHIQPHHGQLNCRMLCHIPLIVPGNCKLRVGNQEKSVQEGELLIFDDSIEHEAFNNSSQDRIVLIIDLWRPELTAEEQKIICSLLEIVDEFQQK